MGSLDVPLGRFRSSAPVNEDIEVYFLSNILKAHFMNINLSFFNTTRKFLFFYYKASLLLNSSCKIHFTLYIVTEPLCLTLMFLLVYLWYLETYVIKKKISHPVSLVVRREVSLSHR